MFQLVLKKTQTDIFDKTVFIKVTHLLTKIFFHQNKQNTICFLKEHDKIYKL